MRNKTNIVIKAVVIIACALVLPGNLWAQEGFGEPEEVQTVSKGPKRIANVEFTIGTLFGFASGPRDVVDENGVVQSTENVSMSASGLMIGIGMHIPVYYVNDYSTVWLIPTATAGILFNNFREELNSSGFSSSVTSTGVAELQLHATYGIGALRKRNSHWGVEGGIGLTYRTSGYGANTGSNNDALNDSPRVLPTVLVDVSYAPKGVYRLRIVSDIFNSSLLGGVSARHLSIGLVFGW